VIKGSRDDLTLAVNDEEWDLLSQVVQQQLVKGERECETRWFGINPALAETARFKSLTAAINMS
jgi:hypothetical protein